MPTILTPTQALQALESKGISIADFARQNDLDYQTVYQVLHGNKKGRRGEAHRAAVALGIKDGVIEPRADGAGS